MGPLVLTEVLFDEKIREQIKKYRRHFLRVSATNCSHHVLHKVSTTCLISMQIHFFLIILIHSIVLP